MDKIVKRDSLCYQVLFNKPIRLNSKFIYGFIIKEDELKHKPISKKMLLEYIVECIYGKVLFELLHRGSFKGRFEEIWIDLQGNEYREGSDQTRMYSYDATVVAKMNFRCDTVYVEDGADYWITDPLQYFKLKAIQDEEDHKQGKNQWMENYLRIKSHRDVLSNIIAKSSENLDFYKQELINEVWFDMDGYKGMDVQHKEDEFTF